MENMRAFADYILHGMENAKDKQRFYDARSALVDYELLHGSRDFVTYHEGLIADFQRDAAECDDCEQADFIAMRVGQCRNALAVWREWCSGT